MRKTRISEGKTRQRLVISEPHTLRSPVFGIEKGARRYVAAAMAVIQQREQTAPPGFGTFGGVFTPCTLTILGVIMFLRFGYVVGEAGLVQALLIVAAAKAITLLTSLSLSAIATNMQVKGGGAYYLISRSLGVEFGGAIGLVFYLAQAIAVAMYVIGFSEAFVAVGPPGLDTVTIGSIVNVLVFMCVYVGAGWTIRVQYFILAILGLSLLSFFAGGIAAFDGAILADNLQASYTGRENLFTMFALFFPAVTGIMAGTNMSGDLRDPARSIPRGTIAAVLVTGAIYATQAVVLAGSRSSGQLTADNMIMAGIAIWSPLITAGIFAATLSSALGSMMGAPRILQAVARDNIFPGLGLLAAGSGLAGEPRRAIAVTFLIAQTCILLADLNTIAPLITMFFMITYGLLNLATFYEAITKNPSYRPRFKYTHWITSAAGAFGCLVVMILIDWRWALVAIAVIGALHQYIRRAEVEARWGDLQSGLLFERARQNLLRLEDSLYHPKNWRPSILALSGAALTRPHLAHYGHWFTAGHGILTLGQVIQGELVPLLERRANQERLLHNFIRDENLQAFPAVVVAPDVAAGIQSLMQCQGLGRLRPNTALIGWPMEEKRTEPFGTTLRTIARLGRSVIVLRIRDDSIYPGEAPFGTIDVWWRGQRNGELMVLLAHLLAKNNEWRTRPIRVLRVIDHPGGEDDVRRHLEKLIEDSRIQAEAHVVVSRDIRAAIQETSANAAICLMGFEVPEPGDEQAFYRRMEFLANGLPRVAFVFSIGETSLES